MEKKLAGKKTQLSNTEIHGKLSIQIIAGRNLKNVAQDGYVEILKNAVYTHEIRMSGYSNPFCKVHYNGICMETETVEKCTQPKWSYQQFYFDVELTDSPLVNHLDSSGISHLSNNAKDKPGDDSSTSSFTCSKLLLEMHHRPDNLVEDCSAVSKDPSEIIKFDGGRISKGVLGTVVSVGSVVLGTVAGTSGPGEKAMGEKGGSSLSLGKVEIDLTDLLTGLIPNIYGWYPLQDENGEESGDVKISVDFALAHTLEPGDFVRLLEIQDLDKYFPLSLNSIMEVEEVDKDFDEVLVTYYSPENWKCTAEIHPNLLSVVTKREKSRLERYERILLETAEVIVESEIVQQSASYAHSLFGRAVNYVSSYFGSEEEQKPQAQSDKEELVTIALNGAKSQNPELRESWRFQPECPITAMPIVDPVVAADGHTYEREAIERWLKDHSTSPMTGQVLSTKNLFKNFGLLNSLEQMRQGSHTGNSESGNDEGFYEEKTFSAEEKNAENK